MKTGSVLSTERLSGLDFVLSGLASALAVFSVGAALFEMGIAFYFVLGVLLSTTIGYFIQRSMTEQQAASIGGLLYAVAAVLGFSMARVLNAYLPGEGIPQELALAGRLSFLLVFASLFAWRDATLLFQAVPCIALFGMVGSWDTFAQAPIAFFAFLLCIATLFGRVHLRAMTAQALHALGGNPAALQRDMPEIRRNAWRWMAGPEWALGSAAAIIMVSLIGAPLLRDSVKDISDAIKVRVPTPRRQPANQPLTGGGATQTSRIGTGPVEFDNRIVLYADIDRPRYLRSVAYTNYNGRGWSTGSEATDVPSNQELDRHMMAIDDPVEIEWGIELVSGNHDKLPFPGELVALDNLFRLTRQRDGTAALPYATLKGLITGKSIVPSSYDGGTSSRPAVALGTVQPAVARLAREVSQGLKTDWEKAQAIKREIEKRCLYNLNAAPVGAGDAVEKFLFESQEGYCDLFASSMVLMARSQGLDARYVVGYYPIHDERLPDGRYAIRDSEAHAWAEIYFEGLGWVPFDATEGAQEVEGAGRGGDGKTPPWYAQTWVIGLGILGGMVGLYYLLPRLRFSFSRRPAPDLMRSELARLYWSFARMVEKAAGKPKRLSQTPFEYLTEVGTRLSAGQDEADTINRKFVSLLYGPQAPESGELEDIRRQLRSLKKALRRA